jgi:hypothetical protein
MPSLAEVEQQIRGFINDRRVQHALLQDHAAWNLLCCCLDTIGDTELAIDAYNMSSNSRSEGECYLVVYGVLQALFIQQDAVENLCQALRLAYAPDPLLKNIREIRNDSAGHPTKRGSGKGRAYNFISRPSLTTVSFDLITSYPEKSSPMFRKVSIPSLISSQRSILQTVLTEVVEKLKKEEAEHRAKYRDQRLQDVFPSTLGYYFQKIVEAIHGSGPIELAAVDLRFVANTVDAFKARLSERGTLDAYDSILYLLKLIEYPLMKLSNYFTKTMHSSINEKDAYIFAFFIERHIEELKAMAMEIDEAYEREP